MTLKGGSVVGPTAQQAPRCTAPRRTAPHRAASRRRESFIIIIRRFANWFIRLNGDNDRPAGFTVGQLYRLFIIGSVFATAAGNIRRFGIRDAEENRLADRLAADAQ